MESNDKFIHKTFNVNREIFLEALKHSPSAQGYIIGAIGEELFRINAENVGFQVLRIKEKPAGGFRAKEIYGDFYIREDHYEKGKAYVVECKGLKSNVEFFRDGWTSKEKVFQKLKKYVFPPPNEKANIYSRGHKSYLSVKQKWERDNPGEIFPAFRWDRYTPGSDNTNLCGLWNNEIELRDWIESKPDNLFIREAYENLKGIVKVLMTHKPSTREATITKIKHAAPLVEDFDILAVDLFLRTGTHEFVYMNPKTISHSPSSPEHLYQNYTIDILVKDKKDIPLVSHPWYTDLKECISNTNPELRDINESQLDQR